MPETTTAVEAAAPAPVAEPVTPAPVVEPAPVEAPADPEVPAAETAPDPAAEIEKWKAQSRRNEARAKANAEKAQRFDEIEEANKTEQQKLLDRAEKAERESEVLRVLALRAEKSASTGVPMDAIPNGTEDDMDTAIATWKRTVEAAVAEALKTRPPAAAPSQIVTAADTTKVKQLSRAELQSMPPQQRLEAYRDGRLDELMGKSS